MNNLIKIDKKHKKNSKYSKYSKSRTSIKDNNETTGKLDTKDRIVDNDTEFKSPTCSPLSPSNTAYSCMSSKHLKELADLWNRRHPEYPIKSNSPREIWLFFKTVFSSSCANEQCWIKNKMFGAGLSSELLNELNDLYAPEAPKSWQKNPRTWLNSLDIQSVMKQYEKKYSCFRFIGPSPIDFDKLITNGGYKECVWDDLCKFNIEKQGDKTKIGIIFNTDPHDEAGEHWVSLFIDMPQRTIVYFDSGGSAIPKEISVFVDKIQKQLISSGNDKYTFIINKKQHQKKNTECGMYSLYFIIQMLRTGNYRQFTEAKKTITDEEMEELRETYFNIH